MLPINHAANNVRIIVTIIVIQPIGLEKHAMSGGSNPQVAGHRSRVTGRRSLSFRTKYISPV